MLITFIIHKTHNPKQDFMIFKENTILSVLDENCYYEFVFHPIQVIPIVITHILNILT